MNENQIFYEEEIPLILIIYDGITPCHEIETILKDKEYRVSIAQNAPQALAMISNLHPKLIILDTMQLGTEQIEICKALKKMAKTEHIQVILSIPETKSDNIELIFQAGADDYIAKPFHPFCLLAKIEPHLNVKRSNDLILQYDEKLRTEKEERKRVIQERAKLYAELKKNREQMEKMIIQDDLTQLYNHRYIIQRLIQEISEARRYFHDLSIILFDIDLLKQVNVTYGYHIGDEVLVKVASVIRDNLRKSDIAGRYSGNEFLVILPHTDNQGGRKTAERIQKNIKSLRWNYEGLSVTVSGGISTLINKQGTEIIVNEERMLYNLIMNADNLLYKAKDSGGNRIEAEHKEGDSTSEFEILLLE